MDEDQLDEAVEEAIEAIEKVFEGLSTEEYAGAMMALADHCQMAADSAEEDIEDG